MDLSEIGDNILSKIGEVSLMISLLCEGQDEKGGKLLK